MNDPLDRPLRIALVDDQPLVRAGFAMVIDSQDDMEVVVQASDGQAAVEELRAHTVDVVLMDVRMPRKDGIEATAEILAQLPVDRAPKIIVLTTFDLDEYVVSAIRAGASGFLLKDARARGSAGCDPHRAPRGCGDRAVGHPAAAGAGGPRA